MPLKRLSIFSHANNQSKRNSLVMNSHDFLKEVDKIDDQKWNLNKEEQENLNCLVDMRNIYQKIDFKEVITTPH